MMNVEGKRASEPASKILAQAALVDVFSTRELASLGVPTSFSSDLHRSLALMRYPVVVMLALNQHQLNDLSLITKCYPATAVLAVVTDLTGQPTQAAMNSGARWVLNRAIQLENSMRALQPLLRSHAQAFEDLAQPSESAQSSLREKHQRRALSTTCPQNHHGLVDLKKQREDADDASFVDVIGALQAPALPTSTTQNCGCFVDGQLVKLLCGPLPISEPFPVGR